MAASLKQYLGRTFASLAVPVYRQFYGVLTLSLIGFWMRIATVGWYVYEVTGSREQLGGITAAALLPWIVFAPIGGTLADRFDQRKLLAILQTGVALSNLGLGIWLLSGGSGVVPVFVLTIVVGVLRGMEHPARHSFIHRLVGTEGLPNAIGLNAACFHFTGAIGPAVGGLLYAWIGPGGCFVLVGLLTVPFIIAVPLLKAGPRHIAAGGTPKARSALAEGFRYAFRHTVTRSLLLGAAITTVCLWSFRTQLAAFAKDQLLLDSSGFGVLMSAIGIGAFSGALWLASSGASREQMRLRLPVLALLGCTAIGVFATSTWLVLSIACLVLAGFCHTAFLASANATIQIEVPDQLRGRVMGIWAQMFGASFPLGSLVLGWAAHAAGLTEAVLGGVALTLIAGGVLFVWLPWRQRRRDAHVTTTTSGLEATEVFD